MDSGVLKGLIAIVTMVTFLGICWWAYRPANRERFEEDAMLAFGDDDPRGAANRPAEPKAEPKATKTENDA
jgi:cytochrome c oxidase cbb3-type subunit 4